LTTADARPPLFEGIGSSSPFIYSRIINLISTNIKDIQLLLPPTTYSLPFTTEDVRYSRAAVDMGAFSVHLFEDDYMPKYFSIFCKVNSTNCI